MTATADRTIKRQNAITDRFLPRSLLQIQDTMSPRYCSRFLGSAYWQTHPWSPDFPGRVGIRSTPFPATRLQGRTQHRMLRM